MKEKKSTMCKKRDFCIDRTFGCNCHYCVVEKNKFLGA